MAKRNQSSKSLSSLVDQVQANLPNFLLGITILVVFILLSSLYLQGGKATPVQPKQKAVQQKKPPSLIELLTGKGKEKPKKDDARKKHTVKEGEYLWVISEQYYGSGYNALDIASANKLENPDVIEVGTVLIIPEVAVKEATKGEVGAVMTTPLTITGSEYIVKEGDTLWDIAQGSYGDGYAWNRIAQANSLANPDIIEVGQKLSLPR
ncbi:hypothetical protein A3G67_04215 [Candidatus Roizmanbacteria bacterium RIFCSPLOWO2_12_FULL_40_12]|uniref:LysM domain-containing protein n=1 Tax=Candidatus Roizmanbacteria bacterium RIFCSPLOWO2_01_FULL_40_42 TaxID=1802066 RepID=A0A1F7J6L8_9BACT|nr:MAG: hypothetical protein A2779_00675 [Candidatus Roizmanbacteria bacterium RIFCSPHIGHO2_01_FULL_40_98]OGK29160.1 MAG: hypothetical protein A3C31_02650 [Candidatus Roizmanbacteria bacterium RIFCSPHIGHO2_02_FULL_40_53]OGK30713.1 MAG: hypothetical protein A2W49_01780 [Candidatus Roizmanbacteria bacterium RIFCSPHIGHO2_12_41_18]OGK37196.1 MAG: hypothetical protein A3E69_01860 [Candidatus Roizmanbacteria bacterium RIFCSPHIGHO2_12_FULL_40_130]OGK51270.1 MAG: hypothetical protein A3B50_04735 [Candi